MKSIGFAQRVTLSAYKVDQPESNYQSQKQKEIQLEINQNKVSIDRTCFSKTPKEKREVIKAKKAYNLSQRQGRDSFFELESI